MAELEKEKVLESIIDVLTVCQQIGLKYAEEHGTNPSTSLATYRKVDIDFRAREISKFVLLHGWCQIHLLPNSHLQLAFKVKAGRLTAHLVASQESLSQFSEVIQLMKEKVKTIFEAEVVQI